MRPAMVELLKRARRLAQSPTARGLVHLVDELVALAELASQVQEAQDAYWALTKKARRNEAQMVRALTRARALEDRLRSERARLGFTGQGRLPGVEE